MGSLTLVVVVVIMVVSLSLSSLRAASKREAVKWTLVKVFRIGDGAGTCCVNLPGREGRGELYPRKFKPQSTEEDLHFVFEIAMVSIAVIPMGPEVRETSLTRVRFLNNS